MIKFYPLKTVAQFATIIQKSSAVFFSNKVVKKGAENATEKKKKTGDGKKSSTATILETFFETAELAKR